jgi:hypothetical protein
VNIQATRDWWMLVRELFQRQPYLTLVGRLGDEQAQSQAGLTP